VAVRPASAGIAEVVDPEPDPNGASPAGDQGGRRGVERARVLVLNASYEPVNVCTVRRATVLVLKERAEIVERGAESLHAERVSLPRPSVIRLLRYVHVPRSTFSRRITRRAVFARDGWRCQYCGDNKGTLTVDHVVPRSKGGTSTWENIVTCCAACNRRKADRLPDQAGMVPLRRPRPPSPTIFVRVAVPRLPESWLRYLPDAA